MQTALRAAVLSALALASCGTLKDNILGSSDSELRVINNTVYTIAIKASECGSSTEKTLGVLTAGRKKTWTINPGCWDVRAIWAADKTTQKFTVKKGKRKTWELQMR